MNQDDQQKLAEARPEFTILLGMVNQLMPVRVLESKRTGAKQHDLFVKGFSKLDYPPGGKHTTEPLSEAVDICPDPWDPADRERMTLLAGMMLMAAHIKGYNIRWGGDWDQDSQVSDNSFDDLFHYEIV